MNAAVLENKNYKTLNVINFGHQVCNPGYSYKYAYTEFYLIHYVVKGCGKVYYNEKCHSVSKGEIFVIKPGGIYQYKADEKDPWEYIWITLEGDISSSLEALDIVQKFDSNLFTDMLEVYNLSNTKIDFLTGKAYEMLSVLFENTRSKNNYIKTVSDYIKANYMNKIYVEKIADSLNINRRYLSRIFKAEKGVSIQQYVINYKIKKACELLSQGFKVSETALMVGYDNVFTFSKIFKKNIGYSPAQYIAK